MVDVTEEIYAASRMHTRAKKTRFLGIDESTPVEILTLLLMLADPPWTLHFIRRTFYDPTMSPDKISICHQIKNVI